jgi:hypothetical protein
MDIDRYLSGTKNMGRRRCIEVMNSLQYMDIDEYLEGKNNMVQRICIVAYLQFGSVELEDNWNQLVTKRQAVKGTIEQGNKNLQQKLDHQKENH